MPNYKTTSIETVSDYVSLIETMILENKSKRNNPDLLFRGQRTDSPLLPKIARLSLNGQISHQLCNLRYCGNDVELEKLLAVNSLLMPIYKICSTSA